MHTFGQWRFDASTGDLFDGQTSTRLEPQVAKLLEYFLIHQNKLTSRDELISSVWENRSVSDDAINRCISILRSHLTPNDKNAFIETVIRRGFISHFPDAPAELVQSSVPSPKNSTTILLILLVVAIVALLWSLLRTNPSPVESIQKAARTTPPTVAVLPFTTFEAGGESEFFASGVHDDLLTQMAQLQSIRVISRTSVLEYKDSKQNIREIGKELGADAILEGSIQSQGGQIRINVQLIDTLADEHLWAKTYDRQLSTGNIFEVQTEIARSIAAALNIALTEQDDTQLKILPTENMAAYRAYHRSMKIRDSLGVLDPAYLAALEEAVKLDPKFVRAWAEITGLLGLGNFSRHDPDSIQRIEGILDQIKKHAPGSADLLIAQSYYSYYILKNYKEAYELAKKAQSMRPSDERVLELKSFIERRMGDFDARLESFRLARVLDPRNPHWTRLLVLNLMITHQYELAMQEIKSATVQTIDLAELQGVLNMQTKWDPDGWMESLDQLETEYGDSVSTTQLWESRIAARDYLAVDELLMAEADQSQPRQFWAPSLASNLELKRLITFWFSGADDRQLQLLSVAHTQLEELLSSSDEFPYEAQYLLLAFLTAVAGETEETKRAVRVWNRKGATDIAEYSVLRHHACRALGMAAAIEAVECIRAGLIEPSYMMPFVEPKLPYYDAIRDTPEFIELLTETGNIATKPESNSGLK